MKDIVSSEDITGIDDLYLIFKDVPGNEDCSMNDFYDFLSTDSPERTLFLEEHCEYSYTKINKTHVLKLKPKLR